MATRKRLHVDDEDLEHPKKRMLSESNSSPLVVNLNGSNDAEELPENANLELFRKEAIFRRMKHYSREYDRSQRRVQELEQRRASCEAGVTAITACWAQLVETVKLLIKPEQLSPLDVKTSELFDLTARIFGTPPEGLVPALEENMHSTKDLVAKFIQLGGSSQSALLRDKMYVKSQTLETENAILQSQIATMKSQVEESERYADDMYEELQVAENRLARLESSTTAAQPARLPSNAEEGNAEEGEGQKPVPVVSTPASNGELRFDYKPLYNKTLFRARDAKIQTVKAIQERNRTIHEVNCLSLDALSKSPLYRALQTQVSAQHRNLEEMREQLMLRDKEVAELTELRKTFEEDVNSASNQMIQEFRAAITKKDTDNLRLREIRDQQAAELLERKQKDNVKLASIHEIKTLSQSRSDRLFALQSEVNRLKAHIASNAMNEDALNFFLSNQGEDASYVTDLRSRLAAAESRASALEQTLSTLQDEHPEIVRHMESESQARQRLSEVESELGRYKAILGDDSSELPSDAQAFSERLKAQDTEIRRLMLAETERRKAEGWLHTELDKLSTAWETLENQVKSKVFELSSLEDRLTKQAQDRSKLENKYYSSMREKETIEAERKALVRNAEKQGKLQEKLEEANANLTSQLSKAVFELTQWPSRTKPNEDLVKLDSQIEILRNSLEAEVKKCAEYNLVREELQKSEQQLKHQLTASQAACEERDTIIKGYKLKVKELSVFSTGTSSQKEEELQKENEKIKTILKCSVCQNQFRNTILLKCMHTFCKHCVDARISTRQRKCPACNLPFGISDVQTLFFQ